MIDVNLLPDSKLEKLNKRKARQLAISISTVIIILSIGLPAVMFVLDFALQRTIASKQESINDLRSEYEAKDDVQEMLTVQSQLQKLAEVEGQKNHMSNLFGLIEFATSDDVGIISVSVDSEQLTFQVQAEAQSIAEANAFIDTLESLQIVDPNAEDVTIAPLTNPLTESFSAGANEPINFSVEGTYNPELGDIGFAEKFVLKPYKVEQSDQGNKTLKRGN